MSSVTFWDDIRRRPTVIHGDFQHGIHESCFRAYAILREVHMITTRGDSVETIEHFIDWALSTPQDTASSAGSKEVAS